MNIADRRIGAAEIVRPVGGGQVDAEGRAKVPVGVEADMADMVLAANQLIESSDITTCLDVGLDYPLNIAHSQQLRW